MKFKCFFYKIIHRIKKSLNTPVILTWKHILCIIWHKVAWIKNKRTLNHWNTWYLHCEGLTHIYWVDNFSGVFHYMYPNKLFHMSLSSGFSNNISLLINVHVLRKQYYTVNKMSINSLKFFVLFFLSIMTYH